MAAKPEPKEAKEAKEAASSADAAPSGASAKGGGLMPWLPAIAAVILAPVVTFAVAEFLLLPRLQARLAAPASAEAAPGAGTEEAEAPEKAGKGGSGETGAAAGAGGTFEYTDVVVNLAGTMGTRYLKTSFVVTGRGVKPAFEGDRARLTDITLSVLSSLTLADLEEPGAKNVLREKLIAAYNQALGRRVVEQVFFSDFVVQ